MFKQIVVLTTIALVVTIPVVTATAHTTIICHKPGKLNETLTIPTADLAGHLGHGDHIGACLTPPS